SRSVDGGRGLSAQRRGVAAGKRVPASICAGRRRAAGPPRAERSVMQDAQGPRRSQERFHCSGGVELRRNEGAPPVFGNLSDISLTGCYVETVSSPPVGADILFMIRGGDTVVRGRAHVKTSHRAVGVG